MQRRKTVSDPMRRPIRRTVLAPLTAMTAVFGLVLTTLVALGAGPAVAGVGDSHTFASWSQRTNSAADVTWTADTDAVDGDASLRFDNATPRASNTYGQLFQAVTVQPGATYDFSGWFKTEGLPSVGAAVLVTSADWSQRINLPTGTTDWQQIDWSVTIPAGQTSYTWRLILQDVGSLWIDDLVMVESGTSTNLLANPSFEDYETTPPLDAITLTLATPSLVFEPGEAVIGVVASAGDVAYTVTDADGVTVLQGTLPPSGGEVDGSDLGVGYYGLHLASTIADKTLDSSFAVLDAFPETSRGEQSGFGTSFHMSEWGSNEAMAPLDAMGTSYARFDYSWASVELEQGVYTFDETRDSRIQSMIDRGIRPLLILNYRNKFYDDNKTPSTPEGLAAWGNYAAAVAEHFGTAVDYEIYNEPNIGFNDGLCGRTADCYYELMVAATDRIREVVPDATLAGPAIAGSDSEWLTRFAELGGLEHIDALSIHPYSHPNPPEGNQDARIAAVRQIIDDYGEPGHDVELWVTEVGWPTSTNYVPESDQADDVARYFPAALAAGADRTYWYEVTDGGTDPANREHRFGLMRYPTAAGALAPKPGYVAYAIAARTLGDATFTAREDLAEGAYGYRFSTPDGDVRALWATTDQDVTIAATGDVTVTDALGRTSTLTPVDGEATLALTGRPVYLEGPVTAVTSDPQLFYAASAPAAIDLDSPVPVEVSVDRTNATGASGPVTFTASTGERVLVPSRNGEVTTATLAVAPSGQPGGREITIDVSVGGQVLTQLRVATTVVDHRAAYHLEPSFSQVDPVDAGVDLEIANNSLAADLEIVDVAWELDGATMTGDVSATIPLGESVTLHADLGDAQIWTRYPYEVTITYADGVIRTLSGTLSFNPLLEEGDDAVNAIDLEANGTVVRLLDAFTGPEDLSGQVTLTRNEAGLVLEADIVDDAHVNSYGATEIWQGDSIQLAVAPGLPAEASTYREIGVALTPAGSLAQYFSTPSGPAGDVVADITRDDEADLTHYRIELPWEAVGLEPGATIFGFSFLVNDNDGAGRDGYIEWGSGIGKTKDPTQYMPVQVIDLAEPGEPQPAQLAVNARSWLDGDEAVLAVYARNEDTVPVDIRFTTPWGATVKFEDVPPGSAAYHQFRTACGVVAGTAAVASYVIRETGPAYQVVTPAFDAQPCTD